uniref:AB hydrolase-1 domain-containing protein n=2 Tax=Caenorhabditis tropicalis TaxID=1561998 RepID=A0A1I7T4W7_9PELO
MIFGNYLKFGNQIRNFAMAAVEISEPKVHKKLVKFQALDGKNVEVQAVYEDSLSSGSSVGTVVAFHGSPGSHKDFKFIRQKLDDVGIRFIGINYPGFKQTEGYPNQQHSNDERQKYTDAFLKDFPIPGKVIFLAHSRGCENALITSTNFPATGLVLLNPVGFRPHKSISPLSRLQRVEWIYNMLPKFLADAMIYQMYVSFGLKVQDGEESINALRSVIRCGLDTTLPYVKKLQTQDTKKFIIFAGRDIIVEEEIVFESLKEYKDMEHFDYEKEIPLTDYSKILETFDSGKGASVFVKQDTHFQNKSRADLVTEVIKKIFGFEENGKNKL